MIVLKDVNNYKKEVIFCSDKADKTGMEGKSIGTFEMDVDGFYYFWANEDGGCWSEYSLKLILESLKTINKPWNDQIQNDLGKYEK